MERSIEVVVIILFGDRIELAWQHESNSDTSNLKSPPTLERHSIIGMIPLVFNKAAITAKDYGFKNTLLAVVGNFHMLS